MPQSATLYRHEPDHILPHQHGGETKDDNVALSWMRSNHYKGPDVASYDAMTDQLVPLFNPRIQNWEDHFQMKSAVIHVLTPERRVTVKMLRFNNEDRVVERLRLIEAGLYD